MLINGLSLSYVRSSKASSSHINSIFAGRMRLYFAIPELFAFHLQSLVEKNSFHKVHARRKDFVSPTDGRKRKPVQPRNPSPEVRSFTNCDQ